MRGIGPGSSLSPLTGHSFQYTQSSIRPGRHFKQKACIENQSVPEEQFLRRTDEDLGPYMQPGSPVLSKEEMQSNVAR